MFRRREDGTEELITEASPAESTKSSSASASGGISAPASAPAAQPVFRPVPPQAAMVAASRSAMPPLPAQPASPAPSSEREPSRAPAMPTPRPASTGALAAKRVLTVGPDIQMKGEITSCDRVVIEGVVDATIRDVHTVELSETGTLKGTAEVEDAVISGSFEGDITVRGKLTVYNSGRVRGNITYGEIEIQAGGQISGSIRNSADAKLGNQPKQKAA